MLQIHLNLIHTMNLLLKKGNNELKFIEIPNDVKALADLTYEIEFNSNEGSGEMENQEISYFEKDKLSKNIFERKGFIFNGWDTEEKGSEVIFSDEEEVYRIASPGAVKKLFAVWEKDPNASNDETSVSSGSAASGDSGEGSGSITSIISDDSGSKKGESGDSSSGSESSGSESSGSASSGSASSGSASSGSASSGLSSGSLSSGGASNLSDAGSQTAENGKITQITTGPGVLKIKTLDGTEYDLSDCEVIRNNESCLKLADGTYVPLKDLIEKGYSILSENGGLYLVDSNGQKSLIKLLTSDTITTLKTGSDSTVIRVQKIKLGKAETVKFKDESISEINLPENSKICVKVSKTDDGYKIQGLRKGVTKVKLIAKDNSRRIITVKVYNAPKKIKAKDIKISKGKSKNIKINFKKNQWSYSLDFKVISGKNNIKLSKKNSRKPSIKGLKKGRSVIEVKTYNNITKKINVNVS